MVAEMDAQTVEKMVDEMVMKGVVSKVLLMVES